MLLSMLIVIVATPIKFLVFCAAFARQDVDDPLAMVLHC